MIWLCHGRNLAYIRHYLKTIVSNYEIGLLLNLFVFVKKAIKLRFPIHTNTYSSDHNKRKNFPKLKYLLQFYLLFKHD